MNQHHVVSDYHFGHYNIIKHCNRPFWMPNPNYGLLMDDGYIDNDKNIPDVHKMNKVMTDNTNSIVDKNDTLWILGDMACRGKSANNYREQINCRNVHLILGNHDDHNISKYRGWSSVQHYKELKYNGRLIIMCHYALRVWKNNHRGSIHFYGHSHGNLPGQGRSCDVGVDCWDFKPQSLDYLIETLEKIPVHKADHHA